MPSSPSPSARRLVLAFVILQLVLFFRAALPLPEPWHAGWPWRMFDRRDPWEKVLEATGVTTAGQTVILPLGDLFRYRRGSTPMRAYDQQPALKDPAQRELLQAFSQVLADRMAEQGVALRAVRLRWRRIHVEKGEGPALELGEFTVQPSQRTGR